jgi:nitrogen fixation protein
MKIHSLSLVHHPRGAVYRAYRDRLSEIAAYIPDVREIKVQSRKDVGGKVELHNVWVAQREVPTALKVVLKPENLMWDDYATWDEATMTCDWELKTRVFREMVRCRGRNTFTEQGGKTAVLLSGDLEIDISSLPGMPDFVARRLGPQVEKFIVSLITPNLERVNQSLERFLDEKG